MKLIKNTGNDRVIDELRRVLTPPSSLDVASPAFSVFAFAELRDLLEKLDTCRIVLPTAKGGDLGLTGSENDRAFRNRLQLRWLARECADWIRKRVELRGAPGLLPQSILISGKQDSELHRVITGNCAFTTEGLGITPGNQFSLIQCSEKPEESAILGSWFTNLWNTLPTSDQHKVALLSCLQELADPKAPSLIYYLTLYQTFKDLGHELDEERIVNSATGIRNTKVWRKLYKFQRDGVVGAIDKLERLGGCIIADSVGLGKTFEALAIIKYYELRNDRVLVLVPKRLRDNWTLYKANDRRNFLASDRFNYDVLNHTDLSRDGGTSGDIDLAHVNWGNYDLVVIDESHNFRNKATHNTRETRYDRLMRRIIKEGVKTRVLMLSATPVNNRLADLKNQIAFVTEGNDLALAEHGIPSIEATVRQAQLQFNRWLALEEAERRPAHLLEMLGFDYFKLLDLLTIARSRKHIEKYYGTSETGKFPERLKPINIKPDVDLAGEFRSIRDINNEIRRLTLATYAPLRYVLPHKQAAYDAKYSTRIRGGESFFRQVDREESLVHLLRVNVLKRMESSVSSFVLTIMRQLADVEATLAKVEAQAEAVEEIDIADVDTDDQEFESLLVGRKVKVLLQDVDRVRWRQDLIEDRNRLATLLSAAKQVSVPRDAKLKALREVIERKCREPLNPGNRKLIIFTAFADTAQYLYHEFSDWARDEFGLQSALVTGTGHNQTTLPNLRKDFVSIITAFSPRSKERPADLASDGEVDLLFATDCVSEGQNLQDCDTVVNYDIHWNPVRIIQRFGRIDRLGSTNERIQLVNFWPNIELEEYINLEQRVSGRMVLLDISATGEENIIEHQSGDQMNDLEYRRRQLLKLQDAVIDLEDLSSGVSIADLTLNDFRIDLAGFLKDHTGKLEGLPFGTFAVTTGQGSGDAAIPAGVIFCLRAVGEAAVKTMEPGYPLAPHYVVHIGDDGAVLLPFTQIKQVLDRLKRLCIGRDLPDVGSCASFDKTTRNGKDTVVPGDDLQQITRRAVYADCLVQNIGVKAGEEFLELSSLEKPLRPGEAIGDVDADALKRLMIRRTIEEHLDKELRLRPQGIKVLSLFFIDAVEYYRIYTADGARVKGKYAVMFEEEYRKAAAMTKYHTLFEEVDLESDAAEVHEGYFSIDKKGTWTDTAENNQGNRENAERAYNLIMKEKEKLLGLDTKLKFIFSHSALREGWDNPNVFQICAMREMGAEGERRQTIGRGLRLCVNSRTGERVRGFDVNTLTVVGTEGFQQFADHLQKEIEQDTGIRFGVVEKHQFAAIPVTDASGCTTALGVAQSEAIWSYLKEAGYVDAKGKVQDILRKALKDDSLQLPAPFEAQRSQVKEMLRKLAGKLDIKNADERRTISTRRAILQGEEFRALWDRIKHKTTYRVQFDNEKLLAGCCEALRKAPPVTKTRVQIRKADLAIGRGGVSSEETTVAAPIVIEETDIELPDLLTDLQDKTQLTRRSLARILTGSGRLDDFKRNPQQFIELATESINRTKRLAIVDGIRYQRIGNEVYYAQELFEKEELTGYLKNMLVATKSVYEHVVYDSSGVERTFAEDLEKNEAVKVYAKLPGWFKVPTPLGTYNPDWAVLVEKDGVERLYFVIETKSSLFTDDLRDKESAKIECGKAHFKALAVGENPAEFITARNIDDLMAKCST